jgi:8-oxo-dGTP pyrophosphatase MutT (NUDIX family)
MPDKAQQLQLAGSTDSLRDVLESLQGQDDYARGVMDALALLGLVKLTGEGARPTGELAGWALAALRAHLADRLAMNPNWNLLGGDGLNGAAVLEAAEQRRMQHTTNPTPTRVVEVAQGIIKGRRGEDDLFLMQHDDLAGQYQWLGGKVDDEDPSPAYALRRELYEELDLDSVPGEDQCSVNLLHADWQTLTISATYGVLTAYSFSFFAVEDVKFPVRTDGKTCWLTRREVLTETGDDGRKIQGLGPITASVLDKIAVSGEY